MAPENNGIYGVFRLSASRWRAEINSICGEFRTDLDFKLLEIPTIDKLFFYGHEKEFKLNFRTCSEAEAKTRILFPSRLEAHYSKKTHSKERNGEGYARISLEDIDFDKERKDLVIEVLDYYSKRLEMLLKKRVRIEVPQKDTQDYKCTVGQLKKYPMPLVNLALQHRYYFLLRGEDTLNYDRLSQSTSGQTFRLPDRSPLVSFKPQKNI